MLNHKSKSEKNGEQKVHGSDQSMKLGVSISYGITKPCQLIRAVIIIKVLFFTVVKKNILKKNRMIIK